MTEYWTWKKIISDTRIASAIILLTTFIIYLIGSVIGGIYGSLFYIITAGIAISLLLYFNNKYLFTPFEKEKVIGGTLKDYANSLRARAM